MAQFGGRLKVVVPGGLHRGAGQYGGLEGLGRLIVPGAGCRVIIIPGRVGAEVALSRSHLVEPSCIELV